MQVVVLAGGFANRMKPLSERIPKLLFPVAGRPFLDRQLELLEKAGATRVLLCVRHLAEQVHEHLAAFPPHLPVALCDDGAAPAGTGGALVRAAGEGLLEPQFLVTYGDSYLPIDFRPLLAHHAAGALPATMAVLRNDGLWDASNCVVEGAKVTRYEKIRTPAARPPEMRWIDYGVSALDLTFVENWESKLPLDLSEPLSRASFEGRLGAFEVTERFYEIGSPSGLEELEALLSAGSGAPGDLQ